MIDLRFILHLFVGRQVFARDRSSVDNQSQHH